MNDAWGLTCRTPLGNVSIGANCYRQMYDDPFTLKSSTASHDWTLVFAPSASGGEMMSATPSLGDSVALDDREDASRLDFDIDFDYPGTAAEYFVWVRGMGPTDNDNSWHIGSDEGFAGYSYNEGLSFGSTLEWQRITAQGSNASSAFDSSTSIKTVGLWMTEDGVAVDKTILTHDADVVPAGEGPEESLWNACASDTDCSVDDACTQGICRFDGTCEHISATDSTPRNAKPGTWIRPSFGEADLSGILTPLRCARLAARPPTLLRCVEKSPPTSIFASLQFD